MKKIYAILMMVLMTVSANAAGELADWYLYVWSDAANAGGDRGQFKTTDTDGVFVLEGVTLTEDDAAGLKFCMRNGDWSVMYGWDDAGGSLDAADKAEFFIPLMVNKLITEGTATCEVLDTTSKWFGVTYAADRKATVARIQKLVDEGVYPNKLF